jgi:hypothetical protein
MRIAGLRPVRSAALPGRSLVVYDPDSGLVVDVLPCEDGHAGERTLVVAEIEILVGRRRRRPRARRHQRLPVQLPESSLDRLAAARIGAHCSSEIFTSTVLPAATSFLPGVELNFKTIFIPILNTSLVNKEILAGTYHWGFIGLIFVSSCVYATVAMSYAVRLFNNEKVLLRA